MKIKSLILIGLLASNVAAAQQPFEKYGYKVKVSTLSQGKYVEDFTSDSLVQVGSVMINRVTGRIASFITYDTTYSEATLDPQLISRWMTLDPLADERYNFSPYNFVQNNPINRIDPTGMLDVTLNGMAKEATLMQINSATEGIEVSMGTDGKLSYTKIEGQEMNKQAQRLTEAIDDNSVDVNINTTNNQRNSNGGVLIGGAFMGNDVLGDGKVKAVNEFDVPTSRKIDANYKNPGGTILHEITEAYEGAKISQKLGVSSGPDGSAGSVYNAAHKAALKQPGKITETYYDAKGNVLPAGTNIENVHNVVWTVKGNPIYSLSIK